MPSSQTASPAAVSGPGAGDARWWFGQLALIKAGRQKRRRRYALVESSSQPTMRRRRTFTGEQDEAFWVLDGEALFDVGGETFDASADRQIARQMATVEDELETVRSLCATEPGRSS